MTKQNESSKNAVFRRRALVEGNRTGKLPVPTGKWVWPTAAIALGVGSLWGAKHIEKQVELAAPGILQAASIDASALQFDASYRNVDVSGELPENNSADHIEMTLAKYSGADGESIRQATVSAIAANSFVQSAILPRIQQTQQMIDEVRVSATAGGDTVVVSGASATPDNIEQSINEIATVLSNFDDNILNAHIDLDNDLISGNITTANEYTTRKVKAFLPTSHISIITGLYLSL